MTVKLFATGVAAVATIGAAAAGVTSLAAASVRAAGAPVVFSAPLDPPPPAPGQPPLPSPETAGRPVQPGHRPRRVVRDQGRSGRERHPAGRGPRRRPRPAQGLPQRELPGAVRLQNIQPIPGNGVKADVAITGPKFAGPVEKTLVFIDQGGTWVLQHDSALALVQAATADN